MRKLNVRNILIVVLIFVIGILLIIKNFTKNETNIDKLEKLGFTEKEIDTLVKYLNEDQINDLLELDKDSNIPKLVSDKYFIYDNLSRYLVYYNKNSNYKVRNIIEEVNTNRDRDYYTDIKVSSPKIITNTLVNKYYKIDENYSPTLENISLQISYEGNKIIKEANIPLKKMIDDAKEDFNYSFIVTNSYRDNEYQIKIYDREKMNTNIRIADQKVARPGHSEHQLGLSVDLSLYGKKFDKFEETEEYLWLKDNSYKYGFIIRYPKDKENITGFPFEPWHIRYVGIDIAKHIFENNITFDEYYEYYISKNSTK